MARVEVLTGRERACLGTMRDELRPYSWRCSVDSSRDTNLLLSISGSQHLTITVAAKGKSLEKEQNKMKGIYPVSLYYPSVVLSDTRAISRYNAQIRLFNEVTVRLQLTTRSRNFRQIHMFGFWRFNVVFPMLFRTLSRPNLRRRSRDKKSSLLTDNQSVLLPKAKQNPSSLQEVKYIRTERGKMKALYVL